MALAKDRFCKNPENFLIISQADFADTKAGRFFFQDRSQPGWRHRPDFHRHGNTPFGDPKHARVPVIDGGQRRRDLPTSSCA